VGAVHWPGRRAFEVDALRIVAAAVTGTLKFVFAGFPVGRTAEVGADRRDDENALGVTDYPNALLILKFGIDAETEVRRIANAEFGLGFVQGAREKEAQEHEQIHAQGA